MNSIQKLDGSHIDQDIAVKKFEKPIVSSLNLVCMRICLRHTTELRCGNPFILQGIQRETCIDRVIGKVKNSFHIKFSSKFIWKLIGISIDQDIDIMKLEKSTKTLQKKCVETHSCRMEFSGKFILNVTYDEENCENSLILYGNLLVLTLTWKQM